ncbi:MAG: amidohydrolase [Oligoflexia bacterium]|nr:amidohydrolase [Oligoflexia bacterium]
MENKFASLVLINANIWTANPSQTMRSQALAVRGDKIIFVGSNDELKRLGLIGVDTKVIDAAGRFVVPGFIDSHIHFLMGGQRLISVQLRDVCSRKQFVEKIASYAASIEAGEWIIGGDWDHTLWGEGESESEGTEDLPTRFLIDRVTPHNPVWITRKEGHMYLANSLAMKLAKVDEHISNVATVEGGTILTDANGILTGIFKDNAINLIYPHVPLPSQSESDRALAAATKYAHSNGVTSIHHMTEPADRNRGGVACDPQVFIDSYSRGKLKIRVKCSVPIQDWEKNIIKDQNQNQNQNQDQNHMLNFGVIKGYVDGSLGSHSAAFFSPYINSVDTPNSSNYCGDIVNSEENLYNWIKSIDSRGYQLFIHAIGDRGINTILNIFERVIKENGESDRRWRIEHAQHILFEDAPRFKKLGVIASMQPYHAIDDGRWAEKILGKERVKSSYACRTLLDAGCKLAFGSDWFVAPPNPILGIHAAVTRKIIDVGDSSDCKKIFLPEQRISVEEALYAYTIDAAYSVYEEKIKGSLEVGKLADFVILDRDLTKIPIDEIEQTKILTTVLGGEIVFDYV